MTSKRSGAFSCLFIVLLIGLSGLCASAQPLLSADFRDTPLPEAFRALEKSGGITVSYDPALVKNRRVTAAFSNKTPADAFAILLRETPLSAEVVRERHVLILERPGPPAPVTFSARLLDAETREPLPYASIFSQRAGRGVQSDEQGRFALQTTADLAPGDTLTIRMLGYRTLQLPAGRATGTDVYLRPVSRELVEITVTDRAIEAFNLPAEGAAPEFRPGRGGLVPSLGEPDPFRMIQFLPGVTNEGDKADELLVRGGSPDQNLVLWEGIPIYHTGHLFGLISALNPYVVDRVNVWKGNFSADYGGRVSSLIDMRTESGRLERARYSAGLNFVNSYFSVETPLFRKKGGLLLAGRYAFSDLVQNKSYQQLFGFATQNSRLQGDLETQQGDSLLRQNYQIIPASAFSDGNLKLWWQPNERTLLNLSVYGGFDQLRYRRELDLRRFGYYFAGGDTVDIGNTGFSLRLRQQWTERYHSEWQLVASNYQSTYRFDGTFDSTDVAQYRQYQENTLREGAFRFDNHYRLSRRQHLQFGFQAVKTANLFLDRRNTFVSPVDSSQTKADLPSNQSSFYGIWRLGDSTRWYFEAGLRHTTFNYSAESYWEPRFSLQWQAWPHLRLKASAGTFHQFMRRVYVQNNLGLNNEVWLTTDENYQLPVLRSRQASAGFSFDKKGWLLDVEIYGKRLEPLTGANLRFNGVSQARWHLRGSQTAGGLELMLRKRWGPYTQWLSYTASQTDVQFDSLNNGQAFPADIDQRRAIGWAHHLAVKRWLFSATWTYHSGRPYTPPTGIALDSAQNATVEYGPRNSARLPDYSRLDVSAQYQFGGQKRFQGTIGLSVFNFFNHANLQNREFFAEPRFDSQGQPDGYGVGTVERTLLGRMVNLFLLMRW